MMKAIFRVIRNNWVDLILLNLAFLIGCIPIVTLPASLAALCSAVLRMQREQNVHIFHDFFHDVKRNFFHALPAGGVMLVGLALEVGGWHLLMAESSLGRERLLPMLLLLLWLYFVFSFGLYAIPLNAQTTLPHSAVFRNALILTLARAWQNVAALLLVGAFTAALVLTFPFFLPLLLLVHFSLCTLICSWKGLRSSFHRSRNERWYK